MNRVFIGWDSRMPVAADVLAYSLRKHAKDPLSITFLQLQQLGLSRKYDPLASTEFTYSRFLIPYLCDYQGIAMFLDNDMLCLADIGEVFALDMTELALRVVKHEQVVEKEIKMDGRVQTSYPRKNWSSMMLMDCSKLRCWTKEAVETQTGAWLHRFTPIPDEQIGEIPKTWNVLDEMKPDTKLVHATSGGCWFKECQLAGGWEQWYKSFFDMVHGR
jgi:hypothetical protein